MFKSFVIRRTSASYVKSAQQVVDAYRDSEDEVAKADRKLQLLVDEQRFDPRVVFDQDIT